MRLPAFVRVLPVALSLAILSSCGGSNSSTPTTPTTPTPPAPPAKGALTVTGMSALATKTTDGLQYPVIITVRETGGANVTVNAVDLVFSVNGTRFGSTHFDSPFSTVVLANSTANSKTLISTDTTSNAPVAMHVAATLAYTDASSNTGTATSEMDIPPLPDPPSIVSFTAAPTSIGTGQSSTLTWSVNNAVSVSLDNGIGSVNTSGQQTVNPTATTTYTLTATNLGGSVTAKATVTVAGAVTLSKHD